MLDIKRLRQEPEAVTAALQRRNADLSIDAILELDAKRRELMTQEEDLRNERNQLSQQVGKLKKAGEDATAVLEQSKQVAEQIKALDAQKSELEAEQERLLLYLPNTPAEVTPTGASEADNVEMKRWGCEFKSRPCQDVLNHWDSGTNLEALDFERGVKVAKSRFTVLRGDGARLNRALIQFMLDKHNEAGYEEVAPPLIVNRTTLQGTGQLPKFEDDLFKLGEDDLFLIPTAEVPITNLYANEILSEAELPKHFAAYTPCFRREAGAAGRDTRGLIRQHQFDKVELVHLVHPDDSFQALEDLTRQAEAVLEALELPYRRVALCSGDLGFSAAACYDLEVWFPAQGVYREISSCSNMTDYQARRMSLRYKPASGGKAQLVHTLNGSALAIGRTLAAILENYQRSPYEVAIPKALQPYLKNREAIRLEQQPEPAHP